MAEGGGLLNRYRVVKPYRGFESLRLRQSSINQLISLNVWISNGGTFLGLKPAALFMIGLKPAALFMRPSFNSGSNETDVDAETCAGIFSYALLFRKRPIL